MKEEEEKLRESSIALSYFNFQSTEGNEMTRNNETRA